MTKIEELKERVMNLEAFIIKLSDRLIKLEARSIMYQGPGDSPYISTYTSTTGKEKITVTDGPERIILLDGTECSTTNGQQPDSVWRNPSYKLTAQVEPTQIETSPVYEKPSLWGGWRFKNPFSLKLEQSKNMNEDENKKP